jgi:hypothetical protein
MRAIPMIRGTLGAKHWADMTVDEIVLQALEGGPVTVDDIIRRLENPVRIKLEKLRVRGVVIREGRGGPHRKFTYKLLRPDRATEHSARREAVSHTLRKRLRKQGSRLKASCCQP